MRLTMLALLLFATVVIFPFVLPDNYYRPKYAEIRNGMTLAEVHDVLGVPTEPIYSSNLSSGTKPGLDWVERFQQQKNVSADWKWGKRRISVQFELGKVIAKSQDGIE